MSYKNDYTASEALLSLYEQAKTLSDNVFTGNRPQAVPEQMKEFIVVSIPSRLESSTYGGGYGVTKAYCNIEIYVRLKKSGMENQTKMDALLGKLLDLFPIQDSVMLASRPKITLRGNDGLGFSAVLVRADLLLK